MLKITEIGMGYLMNIAKERMRIRRMVLESESDVSL